MFGLTAIRKNKVLKVFQNIKYIFEYSKFWLLNMLLIRDCFRPPEYNVELQNLFFINELAKIYIEGSVLFVFISLHFEQ